MTVAPGRTAVVDVLANDLVARRQPGHRSAWSTRRRASRCAPRPVRSRSTPAADGSTVAASRSSTGSPTGSTASQTTLTLRTLPGYNNPPVVSDAFGAVGDGRNVTVDVLSAGPPRASPGRPAAPTTPTAPFEDLRVSDVYAPDGIATRIVGGRVTVERADQPMVVPFRVEDADGGAATGSLYVPAASSGPPVRASRTR